MNSKLFRITLLGLVFGLAVPMSLLVANAQPVAG
jgi:hypothetical protein